MMALNTRRTVRRREAIKICKELFRTSRLV